MFAKLVKYIKESKAEMKHVKWPTRSQTVNATILVIAATIAVALFLGFFDLIFSSLLRKFVL